MIPTLRVLTRKSKLGFGKWKDYTVQELFDLKKPKELISPYFKLTSINYIEDVLIELKLTKKWRIKKPGSNKKLYFEFLKENNMLKSFSRGKGSDIMKIESKPFSKSYLQNMNHGS